MTARLYGLAGGTGARLRPWHHQWLAARALGAALSGSLPKLRGSLLDYGCGSKPYADLVAPGVRRHVGLDMRHGRGADVVAAGPGWPFAPASFDAVLCTQVLEFVPDPATWVAECRRCLRPGGVLVLTAPFIYTEHGSGDDLWRFSATGLADLVANELPVERIEKVGGAGTTLALLGLNTLHAALASKRRTRIALAPLLLLLHVMANAVGRLLDRLDHSGHAYGDVLVVARASDAYSSP